jgi:hypothetical protein
MSHPYPEVERDTPQDMEQYFDETIHDDDDEPRVNWYFTFGVGHKLISVCDDLPVNTHVEGIPLTGRYVKINGTCNSTRLEMNKRWGNAWASQYPEEKFRTLIAKHGYVELTGLA